MEGLFSDDQEKHVAFAKTRKRDWQCVWGEVDEFGLGFEMQVGSEL